MSIAHDALHGDRTLVVRRLTIDHVFATSLRIWQRNRGRVLLCGLLALATSLLVDQALLAAFRAFGLTFLVAAPMRLVPIGLMWAGVAPVVLDELRGTRTPLAAGPALVLLLRAMLGVFLWGLLVGLGVAGLLIPGIVLALLLYVAVPCTMFNRGKQATIQHAARLTKGFRGRLFVLGLANVMLQLAHALVVGKGLPALAEAITPAVGAWLGSCAVWAGGATLQWLLVTPVMVISTTVVFHELSPRTPHAEIDRVFG